MHVVLHGLLDFEVLPFFYSSRRRHTSYWRDWSSDVCSSDLFDQLFQIHVSITKSRLGFTSRRSEQGRHFFQRRYLAHAFASATRGGFDEQRKTDVRDRKSVV